MGPRKRIGVVAAYAKELVLLDVSVVFQVFWEAGGGAKSETAPRAVTEVSESARRGQIFNLKWPRSYGYALPGGGSAGVEACKGIRKDQAGHSRVSVRRGNGAYDHYGLGGAEGVSGACISMPCLPARIARNDLG